MTDPVAASALRSYIKTYCSPIVSTPKEMPLLNAPPVAIHLFILLNHRPLVYIETTFRKNVGFLYSHPLKAAFLIL